MIPTSSEVDFLSVSAKYLIELSGMIKKSRFDFKTPNNMIIYKDAIVDREIFFLKKNNTAKIMTDIIRQIKM